MSDAEDRAGVEELSVLLAERSIIVGKLAALWAQYGPGGLAESTRKNEELRLSAMVRALAVANRKEGEKMPTEGAIEEGARSHPDYTGIMARQTTDRAEYFRLNADMEAVEYRIQRGQALLRMFASEARLTP
jgi:hypothetical protein